MSQPRRRPPEPIRGAFRWLFPGARGQEIRDELELEYAAVRGRHSGAFALVWALAQLLRPATWQLARALRRTGGAERAARDRPDARGGPLRSARGARWPSGLSLDVKLAGRMLVKSPGLTVVGVLGIALGTAVGVGFFVVLSSIVYPKLPLAEGERIVALENWDVEANEKDARSLHDFLTWREHMRSVRPMAAVSMGSRLLVSGDAPPREVRAAALTAAGFEVARVPPLLGRYLDSDDEREGALPVAVLGYELWQAHFDADPAVLGRSVLVGNGAHTIVGVMPPGFAFPRNEELWTALQPSPTRHERGAGPELFVFGRLAPGATWDQAQAELAGLGQRAAAEFGTTSARLRPRVLPYTLALDEVQGATPWLLARVQFMITLILVAIAANISVLVYARTALRQGEIAVRTALGASRRRIVGHLFMEALLLSLLGTGLGLVAARIVLQRIQLLVERLHMVGFWVDYGLQPRAMAYALALALIAAAIVGVVPAIMSTGRKLQTHLRRVGTGGSVSLGRAWTAMIVLQVGVAVAILPTVVQLGLRELTWAGTRATFPAHEVLAAEIAPAIPLRPGMDAEQYRSESAALFAARLPELQRRLEAEPAVMAVTLEGRLPGRDDLVEVEGVAGPAAGGAHRARAVGVAPGYFRTLGARVLAGRAFAASESGESRSLVVSDAFAKRVVGEGAAIGRRVRFIQPPAPGQPPEDARPGPWLEIVGVVQDLQTSIIDPEWAPPVAFYPVAPGELRSAKLLIRVRAGDVAGFASQFRHLTAAVAPELRLGSVGNLAASIESPVFATLVAALIGILISVLLLSAAGIHALTSLAVTRRRREIGIRRAIGSRAGPLLASVFARAAGQLGLGAVLGSLVGAALLVAGGRTAREVAIHVGAIVALMLAAGLGAALGPALRGLRIQPMEALREE